MSAARWMSSRVCAGLHSAPVRRSVDKEIGATRVVVVIGLSPSRSVGGVLRNARVSRFGSGSLRSSSLKNRCEESQKFLDLRPRDDKGRQKAKREVVRAVDQQTALYRLGDKRSAFEGKLDADHEAFRADFANEVELRSEFAESLPQLFASRTDILEKLFLFHDAQKFERSGTSQWPAAERSAMHPGRHARGHRFRGQNGAKRKTASKRFGDQDDIRLASKFLIGKVAPGAAKPALDLVGYQQRAMP